MHVNENKENLEKTNCGKYPIEHDGEYIYVITERCLESYCLGDEKEYPNWTDILEPAFKSYEKASKYLASMMETKRLGGDVVIFYQKNEQVYKSEATHVSKEHCGFEWVTKLGYTILRIPVVE